MSDLYLTDFGKELHALIEKHVDKDIEPRDLVEEMVQQLNSTFGRYNVEYMAMIEGERVA